MTGWLGVDNVNSCCCCELCQPVRCIIDQHEVEIVPATYRSSNSSLAPTTQRSQWSSSSSNNTLPSSRALINEGSIPNAHTRHVRRPDSATYYAPPVDTHSLSKLTCRHSSHEHRQCASKNEKHNSHTSAVAANIAALHQNRRQQSTTHVTVTASDQECTGSHRLALATKKLGSRKSLRAGEKLEEHRMQTGSAKDSAAALRRGVTRPRGNDRPFQLFEQDPQHRASFPDSYRLIHAEQSARSAPLGAPFASALVRARGKLPHVAANVRPVAAEGPRRTGQFESEPSGAVPSLVNWNRSRNVSSKRNNCGTSSLVPSVRASHVFQSLQISCLKLNGTQLPGKPAVCLGGQNSGLTPELFRGASGLSASAVLTSFRLDHDKNTPDTRDTAVGGFLDRNIRNGCQYIVATRGTVGKDGGGKLPSGDTVEDDTAAVPVSVCAIVKKGNARRHACGVKREESFSRPPRRSTTTATAVAAADMESGARQCTGALQLSRALRVIESSTDAARPSDVRGASRTFSHGAPLCSGSTGWGTEAPEVQAGTAYKDVTSVSSHDLEAGGVTRFSGPATTGAFTGTCIAPCSGRLITSQKEENPSNLEPRSRDSDPPSVESFPECALFFYDSSISCADSLACNSVASCASAEGWVAADAVSALDVGGPISGFRADTQDASCPYRGEEKNCLAKDRRQPNQQERTPVCIQHAGFADTAVISRAIASTEERSVHDIVRDILTAETRQEREQDPRLGCSAPDPNDAASTAVIHASRLESSGWQREHRLYSAALEAQMFKKEQQLDQIQQQLKEDNVSPRGRRRKRSTAGKVPLMIQLTEEKLETENNPESQDRCRSAMRFPSKNIRQQYADGANVSLPPGNAHVIPSEKKRKQVCHSLACPQAPQHPAHRHEKRSHTRRKSACAKDNNISGVHDKWRFRRSKGTWVRGVTDAALVNKSTTPEGHRSSIALTPSALRRLCPSSASAQRKELSLQSHTGQAGSHACSRVTPFIYSFISSSATCFSSENALRQNSAQQQHEQMVCSEWQQRCRCSQHRVQGAPRSTASRQDGFTSYAQLNEAPPPFALRTELAESMGTRVVSLSSFSTEVPRTTTPPRPSCTHHVQQTGSQADSQSIKHSEDIPVGNELSGSSDRNTLYWTTSTTNSIRSDNSRSSGNPGGMTFVARSSGSKGGRKDNDVRFTSMATSESSDEGAHFTYETGRRISLAELSEPRAVRRSVEARLVPRGSTAALTAVDCRDDGCARPVLSDSFLRSCCDLKKPSSHRSVLDPVGSSQVLKSGGACGFPCTTSHCFSMSAPVTSRATPGTFTLHEVADGASVSRRTSFLSGVDRDALLPRWYTRTQEPCGKSDTEERQPCYEDKPDRLRCRRSLGSKVKCIGKELGHGLLSKAARLVLWQAKAHLSSPAPPAQLLIS